VIEEACCETSVLLQMGVRSSVMYTYSPHYCDISFCYTIFIAAPCILKIHQLLKTNKCTTMYFVHSKTCITHCYTILNEVRTGPSVC
jgi:hypothetical protein